MFRELPYPTPTYLMMKDYFVEWIKTTYKIRNEQQDKIYFYKFRRQKIKFL